MSDNKNKRIRLRDKTFEKFIDYDTVHKAIVELGARIKNDYKDKTNPLFLGVLNGSFMFMAELMQQVEMICEISFVKMASYSGTRSTETVSELIGLTGNVKGRDIIIVEDIVDTGNSIEYMMRSLTGHEPASIEVATLLLKPDAYKKDIPIKYVALEIPNDFIVGFGLDYDQMGRNFKDIYKLADE